MQRHPDAKACLDGCLQDQLDQSHSILIEAAPEAAQCLIDIIRDGRCKPYSKIEAVKTLFAIVEKGKTEREVADALKSLKEQLTALEGGPVFDVDSVWIEYQSLESQAASSHAAPLVPGVTTSHSGLSRG